MMLVTTTVTNSQANALIEQIYLNMAAILRTITFEGTNWIEDVDAGLQVIAWEI